MKINFEQLSDEKKNYSSYTTGAKLFVNVIQDVHIVISYHRKIGNSW